MSKRQILHSLRMIASFALLGAVVAGILTGWHDNPPVDFRAIGAVVGALGAIIAQGAHHLA